MSSEGSYKTSSHYREEDWVIGKTLTLFRPPNYFVPEKGGSLGPLRVAYETYGALNEKGDNALLVTHALTGSARAWDKGGLKAGPTGEPGWWNDLIGPGKVLDTDRYFVICINILGSCYGSTGPASLNLETGRPYGTSFPVVTVKDMVKVQREVLKYLGIRKLFAVVGGSLGGQQALQWGVTYPELVGRVVAIGCSGRFSAQGIAFNHVARRAIMQDPDWRGGDYYDRSFPVQGLSLARLAATITYKSPLTLEERFGRATGEEQNPEELCGGFAVESYLDYQGSKLVPRFDPNSYLYLIRAMDLFDVSRGFSSYGAALKRITVPVGLIGISTDILFPPGEVRAFAVDLRRAGVNAAYEELTSPYGHDAFLIEFEKMTPILKKYLG